MKKDFEKIILVSITGFRNSHWKNKLKEIEDHKITTVALFLESFKENQRRLMYDALIASNIKKIPLVHIRNDMRRDELLFLNKNFGSKYFTFHENSFRVMRKWKGFEKNLYLEMNNDNFIPQSVKVDKIGGFCVDFSHFKMNARSLTAELAYVFKRRNISRYFKCNHLNGYSYHQNTDLHEVRGLKDFDYLDTLPKFLFGKVIGIETYNSIADQIRYKKHLVKMLNAYFTRK